MEAAGSLALRRAFLEEREDQFLVLYFFIKKKEREVEVVGIGCEQIYVRGLMNSDVNFRYSFVRVRPKMATNWRLSSLNSDQKITNS